VAVAPGTPARLELRGLSKRYDEPVIASLDVAVAPAEFLCVLGPNGCGKSTLLRILCGLESPSGGEVLLEGRPATPKTLSRSIGVVFQEPRLLPWKTVAANVALPLRARGVGREERERRTREALRLVGLEAAAGQHPARVSGGMAQRASIARALAVDPELLLMDEPFSALDVQNRRLMQDEVAALWRRTGATVVFVTHSIDEALHLGTRTILLSARPARVLLEVSRPGPDERDEVAQRLFELITAEVRSGRDAARPARAAGEVA